MSHVFGLCFFEFRVKPAEAKKRSTQLALQSLGVYVRDKTQIGLGLHENEI